MKTLALSLLAALALAACGSSPDEACENIKASCKDDKDISQAFNMGNCVAYFEEDADGREDERDCVADAESCQEIRDCGSGLFE